MCYNLPARALVFAVVFTVSADTDKFALVVGVGNLVVVVVLEILDFFAVKALKVVVLKALFADFLLAVGHRSKLGVGPFVATRAKVFAVGSDFEDSLYLSGVKTLKRIVGAEKVVGVGVHFRLFVRFVSRLYC